MMTEASSQKVGSAENGGPTQATSAPVSKAAASIAAGGISGTTRRIPITDHHDEAQLPPLGYTDSRLVHIDVEDACRVTLTSKPGDPNALWAASRAAAFSAAAKCKIPVVSCTQRIKQPGLVLVRPDVSVVDGIPSLIVTKDGMLIAAAKNKRFEQEGGPSLEDLIRFVDQHSSAPLIDIQVLIRWALFSYLVGHTETHAGQVVLLNRSGSWRLAPFGWMTVFPGIAGGSQYPLARGFKIGTEWPNDHLRVDHWVRLAKSARIHPKVVISIGKELADAAPKAVLEAMCKSLQTTALRGAPADVVRAVQRRCARFKELALLAPRQGVSGLKVQPVIIPPDHSEPERKTTVNFFD